MLLQLHLPLPHAQPGYPGFQQRNLSLELNCLGCAYEFRVQHTHTHVPSCHIHTHIHVAAALLESHLQKSYQHRSLSLSLSLVSWLQSSSLGLWSCCLVPSSPCCLGAIFDTALACHKLPNASNMALKCTRRAKLEKTWLANLVSIPLPHSCLGAFSISYSFQLKHHEQQRPKCAPRVQAVASS